jgi:hypothetical protein
VRVLAILSVIILITIFWSCSEEVTPPPSVSHPAEWDQNHGQKVIADGTESCKTCHGQEFEGGTSNISCGDAGCHSNYPHPPAWTTPKDDNSHGVYIKNDNWRIENCQPCHGDDYRGGGSGESCYTCHTGSRGPESCNVCHGDAGVSDSEIYSWAPPRDVDDNLQTEYIGVGAHQVHLRNSTWTTAYEQNCSLCHVSLAGFDDPNHRNGIVNIDFGSEATNNGTVTPVWNSGNASCSDVYCHGNFIFRKEDSEEQYIYIEDEIAGLNPDMIWNNVGAGQDDCGTCHGLPPAGHMQLTNCSSCHSSVVNDQNEIIDKSKHINGQIDVY